MRTVGLLQSVESSALVLPAAAPGNLGDEALVAATVNYLQQKGVNHIGLISYNPDRQWGGLHSVNEVIDMKDYFSYGSWRSWKALFRLVPIIVRYEQFYCLGADMMDGYYYPPATSKMLSMISVAASIGLDTTVIGFSFNEKPTPDSVQSLRKLPSNVKLCARDQISQERLVKHTDRAIKLVADVAFLLPPSVESEAVSEIWEWIAQQQNNGRIVIGFNPYNQLTEGAGIQTFEQLVRIYVDTLVELYSKNQTISFVLISHDFRTYKNKFSDLAIIEAIFKALPAEIQFPSQKISATCTAANIKAIVGKLDLVLSGKFHLSIACLGQQTPVGCITYQGKFEGLFKHFELEGMMIEPQQALQSNNLVKFLVPLIENRKDICQQIQAKLPKIQELARANFV